MIWDLQAYLMLAQEGYLQDYMSILYGDLIYGA